MKMATDLLTFSLIVILEVHCYLAQSLSRQKTVTMSSQNRDWVGSRAVDGNYNRDVAVCRCCAGTSLDINLGDQWLEIDLGETTEFTRIVVYGQTSGTWRRQNLIGLAIHLDGSETSIASINDTDQGYVNYYNFDLGQKYSTRRIRLILKGSHKVLVLCEVDVFNDSIISKGKDVTAISTYSNWTTSYAVDDDLRTDADVCLCCAATDSHTDPWLNVDLGNAFFITYIQMFGRTDGPFTGQSFGGMSVTIDNVIITHVPSAATFISYYEIVPIPETVGRNVRLTLTGENRLIVMCELVIHGACKLGTYGKNCSESCGNCRADVTCNPGNGHCTECVDGYVETDKTCKTRCSEGRYGYNCSELCGRCRQDGQCGIATGHCNECKDGYTYSDPFCKTACEPHKYGYNCTDDCGNCWNGVACDSVNGYCAECEDGYTNTDKRCPNGTFGSNCQHACGMCKYGQMCDRATGDCPNGCSEGYQGDTCLYLICENERTTISLPVYIGSMVAIACVTFAITFTIMFWRLRQTKISNSEGEGTDTVREPSVAPPNEVASDYESLQLNNIRSESNYSELE